MMRETTAAGSKHVAMVVTPGKGLVMQYRAQTNGTSVSVSGGTGTAPMFVRLARRGSTITAYRSADGTTWTQVGETTVTMASTIEIGLFVTSHDNTRLAKATFDRVIVQSLGPPPPPPPPPAAGDDVVLWAAEAPIVQGWTVTADTTAAGGKRLQNANAAAPKVVTPSASPTQFFEMTFTAKAGRGYRLWMRGKAASNTYANDSAWMQFDKSVDAAGNPVYRIGSTTGADVNLEDCSGCGVAGWGWQDNGYGVGVLGPLIFFASDGPQRIRVQIREDGLGIDQIVLSSVKWVTTSPGALKNDTVILAKQ
jgi:hypothetical protein